MGDCVLVCSVFQKSQYMIFSFVVREGGGLKDKTVFKVFVSCNGVFMQITTNDDFLCFGCVRGEKKQFCHVLLEIHLLHLSYPLC